MVHGAWGRPEDADAGGGVGRAVAGAAEPAFHRLPGIGIDEDEVVAPGHRAAEVGTFVPEGEKSGAALLRREVYQPELTFEVVVGRGYHSGRKLVDRAG